MQDRPSRETRGFAEREAPYRDMADEHLREVLQQETGRAVTAIGHLAEKGPDASFEFTGATFTAEKLQVHAASEFAIHRWDLVGDDETSEALLSDPLFTEHAVDVLNKLPVLDEAPGQRAGRAGLADRRIVLRAAGARDVALTVDSSGARFELGDEGSLHGDLVITTDAVNRLLTLWGRHSNRREVTVSGNLSILNAAGAALWPTETEWPDRRR